MLHRAVPALRRLASWHRGVAARVRGGQLGLVNFKRGVEWRENDGVAEVVLSTGEVPRGELHEGFKRSRPVLSWDVHSTCEGPVSRYKSALVGL